MSPNRYITWVKLKNQASGKEIVRINTHLVSGAWGEHEATTAWRREHWKIHMQKLEHMVAHFKAKGLQVIVGGDFNRDSFEVLGKKVGAHVQHGYASDHDAVVARYAIR